MYAFGYSLDNLSLMALTLAVGFVVDDAIVMLENIVRHMEMGKSPMEAAFAGSKEVAFTILSMTVSLAAVFIPVLFMGGIVGRLMHEFAVTIAAAILVSGVVSVTLTPMLCSRFLKPPARSDPRLRCSRRPSAGSISMLAAYAWTLRQTLRFRPVAMADVDRARRRHLVLFDKVPTGSSRARTPARFMAPDRGLQGIGFEAMLAHQYEAAEDRGRRPQRRVGWPACHPGRQPGTPVHRAQAARGARR